MPKKSLWSKISGLNSEVLVQQGEDAEIKPRKTKKKEKTKQITQSRSIPSSEEKNWFPETGAGQLVVDLYEKDNQLIIESTIAGVGVSDLDITVEPDLIVIRGERKKKKVDKPKQYYYQECFWGKFSRTLVLPFPIEPDKVKASLKNGILIIALPKASEKNKSVKIKEKKR